MIRHDGILSCSDLWLALGAVNAYEGVLVRSRAKDEVLLM